MTFPSDHSPTCSWCGAVLPEGRAVFCDEPCQERYNRSADQYYEARHNPHPPETSRLAGQPIPGSPGHEDWLEVAAGFARAWARQQLK